MDTTMQLESAKESSVVFPAQEPQTFNSDVRTPRGSSSSLVVPQPCSYSGSLHGSKEFKNSTNVFSPMENVLDSLIRNCSSHVAPKKCPSSRLAQSFTPSEHEHEEEEVDEEEVGEKQTGIISPPLIEQVTGRMERLEMIEVSQGTVELVAHEEMLPEQAPKLDVQLPELEPAEHASPIRRFVSQLKGRTESVKKVIRLSMEENPISQRTHKAPNLQATKSSIDRMEAEDTLFEPGRLLMRVQSVELQPARRIPHHKSIENGHVIAIVSLGNQSFDCVSNPIVCLDNADPRALFDHVDGGIDASLVNNGTMNVAIYFQDQDSMKGKRFKKLRSLMHNLVHKKRPSENALHPVPSTLSTLSTVSARTGGHNAEVPIGRTDIEIRSAQFAELFAGKMLDMNVKFEGNQWIKSMRITCCFVPTCDLIESGFPKRVPKNLNEGTEFIEYRNVMRSVNYECLLAVKRSNESVWTGELCQFRGYRIFCFDKLGRTLKRIIDLRHLASIADASNEVTGKIPKHFRLFLNQKDYPFIDFLANSANDYNQCMDQLVCIQKTLASVQLP